MSNITTIDLCILCSSRNIVNLFKLKDTPLANEFVADSGLEHRQETFPLHLNMCSDCDHVQLGHSVNADRMFLKYSYVSGTAKSFVQHFHNLADKIIETQALNSRSFVVEIGSNDGTLLKRFKDNRIPVLGVDPAANIASLANQSGIPTRNEFFSFDVAVDILANSGPADVVIANNVLAHTTQLKDIVIGVKELLAPKGVLVFEVSYLLDVVQKLLFDTIYHEHVSYHSIKPLRKFFDRLGLEIFNVELVASHGGSIRVYVQHKYGPRKIQTSVEDAISAEEIALLNSIETYILMKNSIDELKTKIQFMLSEIKTSGKNICGFGAPAKATTLMYEFDIGTEFIDFIVDDSPLKQGTYTPGLHIPIQPRSYLQTHQTNYMLILAWNFATHIVSDLKGSLGGNIRFIVPLPELVILQ
jgi:SAM-dependent methyltransferase